MVTTAIDIKASYNHKSSQNYLFEHRKTKTPKIKPSFEHKSSQNYLFEHRETKATESSLPSNTKAHTIMHLNTKAHINNNRK